MCWLQGLKVLNKNMQVIDAENILKQADIIVILFNAKGIDKNKIIKDFYRYYEDAKYINIPLEVINVPFDETELDFRTSFKEQANWFTLEFGDPIIPLLPFICTVTSLPHIQVIKPNGNIVSNQGIFDLERHGRDAIISWISTCAGFERADRKKKEHLYGYEWKYCAALQKAPYIKRTFGPNDPSKISTNKSEESSFRKKSLAEMFSKSNELSKPDT